MHEKIYEKLNENEKANNIKYMHILGIIDDDFDETSLELTPNRNIDLLMLLSKFDLIKESERNLEIINDFYDYIFKEGIRHGIRQGKKLIIKIVKENRMEFSRIMAADTKHLTDIQMEPNFIYDFNNLIKKRDSKSKRKGISLKHLMAVEMGDDEYKIICQIRDEKLNILFDRLKVDKNDAERTGKKIITIRNNPKEYPFTSRIYKNHKGKYKFQTLLDQYMESIVKEGMIIGMQYGKKFIVDDLQNRRFSREFIENMGPEDIEMYCDEVRDIGG